MSVLVFFTLSMVPIGCPKTLVRNYHYSLRNNPVEHSFHVGLCLDETVLMTISCEDLCISVYMSIHIPVLHMYTSCRAVDVCAIRKIKCCVPEMEMSCFRYFVFHLSALLVGNVHQ